MMGPPALSRSGSAPYRRGMTVIEVFADIACPFTHVGLRRLVDRRRTLGPRAALGNQPGGQPYGARSATLGSLGGEARASRSAKDLIGEFGAVATTIG